MVELPNPSETELCAWGCGRPARFYSDKSRKPQWTCSRQWQKCPAKIGVGRSKYKATMLSRFGVEVPMKNRDVEAKRRCTNLERYGVELPMQSEKVQRKAEKTLKARHGVSYPAQVFGATEKAKKTRFDHTGYSGVNHAKTVLTSRIKYGTDWPIQNPEVFAKNLASCFKSKAVTLPSGALVFLQGYEPLVLDYLFNNGYSEHDFLWANKPSFWYEDASGKRRRYHPDFVLPDRGVIIEVKAQKWFERDYASIVRKGRACQEAGWEFALAVMGNKIWKHRYNEVKLLPFRVLDSR